MAERAGGAGMRALVVPAESAGEAALIAPGRVIPIDRLAQLRTLGAEDEPAPPEPARRNGDATAALPDLADLRGQPALRRALEIAAAGGHSLLVTGPPGAGKSMAARRLPSILPPLDEAEVLEAARVASACGRPVRSALAGRRPFRAPHHTISTAGLIGGGNPPRAGEVTLAHATIYPSLWGSGPCSAGAEQPLAGWQFQAEQSLNRQRVRGSDSDGQLVKRRRDTRQLFISSGSRGSENY